MSTYYIGMTIHVLFLVLLKDFILILELMTLCQLVQRRDIWFTFTRVRKIVNISP